MRMYRLFHIYNVTLESQDGDPPNSCPELSPATMDTTLIQQVVGDRPLLPTSGFPIGSTDRILLGDWW